MFEKKFASFTGWVYGVTLYYVDVRVYCVQQDQEGDKDKTASTKKVREFLVELKKWAIVMILCLETKICRQHHFSLDWICDARWWANGSWIFLLQEKEDEKDKNAEESTVEKSEKESSEKMEEEEPDFELLENPARVLPAQVS